MVTYHRRAFLDSLMLYYELPSSISWAVESKPRGESFIPYKKTDFIVDFNLNLPGLKHFCNSRSLWSSKMLHVYL
jgi:hypothetical protein